MNGSPSLDRAIRAWLQDGPSTAPADLLESARVDIPAAHRQVRGIRIDRRLPMVTSLARLVAAAAIVLVVGYVAMQVLPPGNAPVGGVGASPSSSPERSADASPSPSSTTSDGASPSPVDGTPAPSPATTSWCLPHDLAARITSWDGATGHRIAVVTMTNTGPAACRTYALDRPQLIGPDGAVLIDGTAPAPSEILVLSPGGSLTTMAQDANYCGPAVSSGPITVAFVLASGAGRVIAAPLEPADLSPLPPCNGAPGSAGDIEMHPWAP